MMLAGPHQTSWGHRQFFVPTTWNPADKAAEITLSNGDLTASCSTGDKGARGVLGIDLDAGASAYAEFTIDTVGRTMVGAGRATAPLTGSNPQGHADSWVYSPYAGTWENTGGSPSAGATVGDGGIVMLAVKGTKIWWGGDGTWFQSGDPAGDANPAFSNLSGVMYPMFICASGILSVATANFGQSAFTYTPPAGITAGWGAIA